MIRRVITTKILQIKDKYPVIAITGPRQSGKTTLVKAIFPEMDYTNLEEPDVRLFAEKDPRLFLSGHTNGLIIDEAQRVPDLFSYIQVLVDENKNQAPFVLTGSHHFLLHEKISQTLAGRVAIFNLLPFSLEELSDVDSVKTDYHFYLFKGFYPPIYDRDMEPEDWFPFYIQTYLERDVRSIKNIGNLNTFTLFLKLCAGRIGSVVNYSAIANEAGISVGTVRAWISILQTSFIIFLLHPYHKNFNKRLIKMPKLYFYDTGLAASLLNIENQKQMLTHYLKGSLFENMIISEIIKWQLNRGKRPSCYFWRDKLGKEIDCILDIGNEMIPVEIKSGQTITKEFFKNINYWNRLSGNPPFRAFVIYGGNMPQIRSEARVIPWFQYADIFNIQNNIS